MLIYVGCNPASILRSHHCSVHYDCLINLVFLIQILPELASVVEHDEAESVAKVVKSCLLVPVATSRSPINAPIIKCDFLPTWYDY